MAGAVLDRLSGILVRMKPQLFNRALRIAAGAVLVIAAARAEAALPLLHDVRSRAELYPEFLGRIAAVDEVRVEIATWSGDGLHP
jgi:hypothetical protein